VAKTETRQKVLVVSRSFPPQSSIAALRAGKFAKYLPQFGWDPIVLTINEVEGQPPTTPLEIDESRVVRTHFLQLDYVVPYEIAPDGPGHKKVPPHSSTVKRVTHSLKQAARFVYSVLAGQVLSFDGIGWYPYAVKRGIQLLNEVKVKVIFSSSPPFTSHLIASYLHRKTNIPWVAEFRDLWALNHYTRKRQPFFFMEKRIEKWVMRGSSLLVTVSEPLARDMETLHLRRVTVIPNGFDDEDYAGVVPLYPKFIITYTGALYRGKQDTSPLFEAVKALQKEAKICPGNFEIRFFGRNVIREVSSMVDRYHLRDLVKVYGFVPFRESIRRQKESTALLLLGWNDPRDKGIYTGKIFEYLGAGRPILAVGLKDGVVDRLLSESGAGVMLSEVSEIKGIIDKWLEEFRTFGEVTSYYKPSKAVIARFTRRKQTERLAVLLDEASGG
jgi:glycosyltransferase involved in cell wall biosynthesis